MLVARRIKAAGYALSSVCVASHDAMRSALLSGPWDAVISDVNMPGFGAEGALALHRELGGGCPFIVVSGVVGEEAAVSLLKAGANDFVLKGNLARLVPALEREIRDAEVRQAKRVAEEEMRRAREEAEKALAAKTRFLAAASHDLRQPVQALFCLSYVLVQSLEGHPSEEVARDLDATLVVLKSLLDALLDVSKLDAGLIQANIAPTDLGEVLAQLTREAAPLAAGQGLALRSVPCSQVVATDPVLLARMLRNLLENAIRYTEQGKILLGCRLRGDHVGITVADSGIGIAPELQGEVFEEFYQVANSERDRRKGLGLGLAVVRRLSRMLDHPVELVSAPGKGSAFQVLVPRALAVAAAMGEVAPDLVVPDPAKCLIVVIDDEPVVRRTLVVVLNGWGYGTIAAGSAVEAVHQLAEASLVPDLIIADYRLAGGVTGTQAIETLRQHFGQTIPAVVVTGDTAPERLREAVRGHSELLHKPIRAAELQHRVAELLAKQPSGDARAAAPAGPAARPHRPPASPP